MLPLLSITAGITSIIITLIIYGLPMAVLVIIALGLVTGTPKNDDNEELQELRDRVRRLENEHDIDPPDKDPEQQPDE